MSPPRARASEVERARRLIEDYTGQALKGLDVYEDPGVPGTLAVRAEFSGIGHMDYLVLAGQDSSGCVEEAEFFSWPPTTSRRSS